jgi:DNA-binding HxlR family transcriptional regulator
VAAREESGNNGAGSESGSSSEPQFRAGGQALTLLSTPLNLSILRSLAKRPMRLAELRSATGLPAQTTLRGHLAGLEEVGALRKRAAQKMPYAVENELTPMGEDLLGVAASLERWLERAPDGPISLESGGAKGVVKALVDGWESTMMRWLALRPMSLTELDREIAPLSYPALERRLSSMRMAGLIEAKPGTQSGTPYTVTEWARRGVAPLAEATYCESVHLRERAAPVTQVDVEAAFLLASRLVGLPAETSGTCQLEVEAGPGEPREPSGVRVEVEGGRVVYCGCELDGNRPSYAVGTTRKWFTAIKEGTLAELRFGGGSRFAESFVRGLHSSLGEG